MLWRRRYTLRLRDLAAMFRERGCVCRSEVGRDWAARCAPLLTVPLRAKRRGTASVKCHANETSSNVNGRCSPYRALDRDGNLIEAPLSERRDMAAAQRCCARALDLADHAPEQVPTGGHDADSRASRETLGPEVHHRTSRSQHNRLAQGHRAVKQR